MNKLLSNNLKIVAWEITKNCNLSCIHCRASAKNKSYNNELTKPESYKLLDEIAAVTKPIIILTGGEPLLRKDIFDISSYGNNLGLRMVMALNGTLIDEKVCAKILASGIKRISISLDGFNSSTHDKFRGIKNSFNKAINGIKHLKKFKIDFQINTTITKNNLAELNKIINLAEKLGAIALHIFLLVPTGRGKYIVDHGISKKEYERTLNWLCLNRKNFSLQLKITCAPHYYRLIREEAQKKGKNFSYEEYGLDAVTRGCLAGTNFCFISNTGTVQPCGYTSISCGNILENKFETIWNKSKIFKNLRNLKQFKGKCKNCKYISTCGGCRARAFEFSGNYMDEEPFCVYQPN